MANAQQVTDSETPEADLYNANGLRITALCDVPNGPRLTFFDNVNNGQLSVIYGNGANQTNSSASSWQDLDFDSGNSDSASLGSSTGAGHTIDTSATPQDHGTFTYQHGYGASSKILTGSFVVKHNVAADGPNPESTNCVTHVQVIG